MSTISGALARKDFITNAKFVIKLFSRWEGGVQWLHVNELKTQDAIELIEEMQFYKGHPVITTDMRDKLYCPYPSEGF